jgi:hypothetical protein
MLKGLVDGLEGTLRRGERQEVARRDKERSRVDQKWLILDEQRQLTVLAALVLPSDETGPGAADAKVVEGLDKMLAASPGKQEMYAAGLASLDRWARRKKKGRFVELLADEQLDILRKIDSIYEEWSREVSRAGKVQRKITALRLMRAGEYSAVEFFPRLVRDVMQVFYTSRVAWNWLGYDGPPMPQGYSDLWSARESASTS